MNKIIYVEVCYILNLYPQNTPLIYAVLHAKRPAHPQSSLNIYIVRENDHTLDLSEEFGNIKFSGFNTFPKSNPRATSRSTVGV